MLVLFCFFTLSYCLSHHLQGTVHDSDPIRGHDSDSTAVGPGYFSSTRRGFLCSSFDGFFLEYLFASLLLLSYYIFPFLLFITNIDLGYFIFYFLIYFFDSFFLCFFVFPFSSPSFFVFLFSSPSLYRGI